ncbi:ErmE/ErmH/ErmO/ErmR family 23S rRNA (adenine(2058)-N(6))-methyltransferase [Solwaraspora sp. WMMD1047]|uniref:ErmE/ErmH/ErmO/ErmR family 23S rRNA (adenine(2058)-N(6))-methyltransferase n=1 Tax=Solwaraspora sp. WMMD1047 TaxID=3016102 RepID=UPI002416C6D9|nr:ErmE/ErmH/ErmO/ErmR family 23S rRNA (adenine(2058)-N(6))-methyltransferase [Solwaraspora sp. WMMD1047]MDG4831308.1 ErmE/ErmH/ErmO/ErmR family 23S rRNA (adenine(2058)-N(6))-methyltransferase [Solwaraspora sp. WMMD1047]
MLGQNFLRDPAIIAEIVRAARPGPDDLIIEVGAGRGSLTRPLARACRALVAYEVDPDLAARLAAESRADPSVRVLAGDFLASRPPDEPFAVVGNIPYASTTRIVEWCLAAPRLTAATLVTQLEYARKRCGDYGRWSMRTVQTWPLFDWRLAGRIPRHRFHPAPRVDAAILRLSRRAVPALGDRELAAYERFVALGFSGVGGSLRASLCRGHDRRRVEAALRSCRVSPETVVGQVWPEQWIALFRAVHGRR